MAKLKHFKLFSGTSHPALAGALAKELGTKLGEVHISRFACGEIYAKPLQSVRGNHIVILQTATSSVNEDYMELFIMIDAMKRSFASKVTAIIPHFGYARQDRVATPREPISAKVMANLLAAAGADHVISIHMHSDQSQGFFPFPMDNLSTRRLFVDVIRKKKLKDLVIVAPDAGAAKEAGRFAELLNVPLAVLTKRRPRFNEAEVTSVVGDIVGKTCLLYDDMIDTAGSVCAAQQALLENGANPDVYLVATHALFSPPAVDRLREAKFKEVIVTDTLPIPASKQFPGLRVVSVAPMLAQVIQRIEENRSVTEITTS